MSLGVLKTDNITAKEPVQTTPAPSPTVHTIKIDRPDARDATGTGNITQATAAPQQPLVTEPEGERGSGAILIRSRSRDSPSKTFEGPGGTPRMTYGNPFDGSPSFQPNSIPRDKPLVTGTEGIQTRDFSFTPPAVGPSVGIKVSKTGPHNQTIIEEVAGFTSMHNSQIETDKQLAEPAKISDTPIVITSQPRNLPFGTLALNQANSAQSPIVGRQVIPTTAALPPRAVQSNQTVQPASSLSTTGDSSQQRAPVVRLMSQPQSPRPNSQLQPQVIIRQNSPGPLPNGSVIIQAPTINMQHPSPPQVRVVQQQFQVQPLSGQTLVSRPLLIPGQPGGFPVQLQIPQPIQAAPAAHLLHPSQERPPTRVLRAASQSPPLSPAPAVAVQQQAPLRRIGNLLEGLVPESRVKTLEAALSARDAEISRLLGLLKSKAPSAAISSETGNIKPSKSASDLQQQVQKLVVQMEAALSKPMAHQEKSEREDQDQVSSVLSQKQISECITILKKVSDEQLRSIHAAEKIHEALLAQQEERKRWQELAEKLMVKVKDENKKRKDLEKILTLIPSAQAIVKKPDMLKSFGDPWNDPPKQASDKNPYADSMEDRTSSLKPRVNDKNPYKSSGNDSPEGAPTGDIQGLLGSLGRRLHTAFGGSNPYEESDQPQRAQQNTRDRNPFAFGSMIGHAHNNRDKKNETETETTPLNPIRLTIAKNNLVYGSMVDDPNKQNEFSGNQDSPEGKNIDPEVQRLLNRTSAIVLTETRSNQSPDQNRAEQRPSSPLGYYGAVSEYPVSRPGRKTQGDYQDSYYEDDGKLRKFSLTPPPPADEEDSIVVPVNMSDGNPHTNDGHATDPKADMIRPQKINSVDNSEKELHVMPIEDFRAMREELERLQHENDQLGEENSELKKKIMQLQEEIGEQRRQLGGGFSDRPSPREKLSINVEAALQFAKIRETHEKSEIISYPAAQNLYTQKLPPTVTEVSKDDFGLSYSFRPKTGASQMPLQSQFDVRDKNEEFQNNPSFGNPSAFMLPNSSEEVQPIQSKQAGLSFFGGDKGFQFAQADFYPAESKTDQSSAVSPKDKEPGMATADTTLVGKILLGQIGAVGHKSAGHLFKQASNASNNNNVGEESESRGYHLNHQNSLPQDFNRRRELSVELSHKTAELTSLRDEITQTKQQLAQVSVDRDHLTVGNQRMQAELAKMARILKENNKDKEKMAADIEEMKEMMRGLVAAQAESRIVNSRGDPLNVANRSARTANQQQSRIRGEPLNSLSDPERKELESLYRSEYEQYRSQRDQVCVLQDQQTLRKLCLRERIAELQKQAAERHTVMRAYLSETEALGQEGAPQLLGLRRNLLGGHAMHTPAHLLGRDQIGGYTADRRQDDYMHGDWMQQHERDVSGDEEQQPQPDSEAEDFREHHVDYHLDTEVYGEEEHVEMTEFSTPPRDTETAYQLDQFPDEAS